MAIDPTFELAPGLTYEAYMKATGQTPKYKKEVPKPAQPSPQPYGVSPVPYTPPAPAGPGPVEVTPEWPYGKPIPLPGGGAIYNPLLSGIGAPVQPAIPAAPQPLPAQPTIPTYPIPGGGLIPTIERDFLNLLRDYVGLQHQEALAWQDIYRSIASGQIDLAREQMLTAARLMEQRMAMERPLLEAYTAYTQTAGQLLPYQARTERLTALTPLVTSPLIQWYTARGEEPPRPVMDLLTALLQTPTVR